MIKMRLFFAIIIFLFILPISVWARLPSDIIGDSFEETTGRGLEIRTNPPGVTIYINGVEQRILTPAIFENLSPGEHSIRLERDGYTDRNFNVTLFTNSRLVVSIEMEEERGNALVTVHRAEGSPQGLPFSPEIFTRDLSEDLSVIRLSDSHTALLSLTAGMHTIRARAFGWEDAFGSVIITEHVTVPVDIYMQPAVFSISKPWQSRRRFNPNNAGSLGRSEYRFEVSTPSMGRLKVFNSNNEIVYEKQLEPFDTWIQHTFWDGRDMDDNILPEGFYTVLIEAQAMPGFASGSEETESITLTTEINYSLNIFPLSLSSGVSGLALSPLPHTIPFKSFQFESSILLGSFIQSDKLFSSLPFDFGFRVSPLNRMEVTGVFNVKPGSENSGGWGVSGSLKYNFLDVGSTLPIAFSAAGSASWALNNASFPLSAGSGYGLYTPVSLELQLFSIVFSPAVFWHPDSFIPSLLLSSGIIYKGGTYNAGLSVRQQLNFEDSDYSKIMAVIEGRFFPPPSYLVLSFQAGMWTFDSKTGGFAGLGIGFIF